MDFIVYIRNTMADIPTTVSMTTGYFFRNLVIFFPSYLDICVVENIRDFTKALPKG